MPLGRFGNLSLGLGQGGGFSALAEEGEDHEPGLCGREVELDPVGSLPGETEEREAENVFLDGGEKLVEGTPRVRGGGIAEESQEVETDRREAPALPCPEGKHRRQRAELSVGLSSGKGSMADVLRVVGLVGQDRLVEPHLAGA